MSARACGRLPALRAFDTRRPRGREERPPGARQAAGALPRRESSLRGRARAPPTARAPRCPAWPRAPAGEQSAPRIAESRVRAARTPGPCARWVSRQVQLRRPVASGGGEPPTDREQPPRAYLRRSSDGRRGAPGPRGVGGAGGGPGGCAARRPPTFPPPALPGEPTGRAASAPVRTRRAAFHRGGRGAGRGREEAPAGGPAARPPSAVPPGRSCAPPPAAVRGEAEPPGTPWAGVGPLRQEAVCEDRGGGGGPRSFLGGSEGVGNPPGPREQSRPRRGAVSWRPEAVGADVCTPPSPRTDGAWSPSLLGNAGRRNCFPRVWMLLVTSWGRSLLPCGHMTWGREARVLPEKPQRKKIPARSKPGPCAGVSVSRSAPTALAA